MDPEPYGLLAGAGDLPRLVVENLRDRNRSVVAGFLTADVPEDLADDLHESRTFRPEHFGDVPEFFAENGVNDLVMAGTVDRSVLYDDDRIDSADDVVRSNLSELDSHEDEQLIETAVEVLEASGLNVVGIDRVLRDKLSPGGHLAGPEPSGDALETLDRLRELGVLLADRDVGQTVLGKRNSVVAVEAAEGTDRAIRRAGRLAGPGLVMVKSARTEQDYRLDVPVVGESTVSGLVDVKADLLAVEADRTLWVQRNSCRELAEEHGLTIYGWER